MYSHLNLLKLKRVVVHSKVFPEKIKTGVERNAMTGCANQSLAGKSRHNADASFRLIIFWKYYGGRVIPDSQ